MQFDFLIIKQRWQILFELKRETGGKNLVKN